MFMLDQERSPTKPFITMMVSPFYLKGDMQCDRSHQLRETCEDKWHLHAVNCPGLSPDFSDYGR